MKLRLAVENDYFQIEEIMKEVQKLHVDWSPESYKLADVVLPHDVFLNILETNKFIVAIIDNKVVGVLIYDIHHREENSTHVEKNDLFIDTIAIKEEYRHQGIGSMMIDFLVNKAKADGFDFVCLQVNAKNEAAREMYEHYGFEKTSINMQLKVK